MKRFFASPKYFFLLMSVLMSCNSFNIKDYDTIARDNKQDTIIYSSPESLNVRIIKKDFLQFYKASKSLYNFVDSLRTNMTREQKDSLKAAYLKFLKEVK